MIAMRFTFTSRDARQTFRIIGTDRMAATRTAFELASRMVTLPCYK